MDKLPDHQRRLWNRGPLLDLFPRLPSKTLESLLDICLTKSAIYDLSESKHTNSLRLTSLTVAHCRHNFSDYDTQERAHFRDGVAHRMPGNQRLREPQFLHQPGLRFHCAGLER